MTDILYQGKSITLAPTESALDALLREGHEIPFGCRAGACQSCLMVSNSPHVPASAQQGLSDAHIELNYFLACMCRLPSPIPEPLEIEDASFEGLKTQGIVISKDWLNAQILRIRLSAELTYLPGQYVTLWSSHGIARSYSIASHPVQDDYLEFHIKVFPGGQFSQWASETLQLGDTLDVQGPIGTCIYAAATDQPLLLAAIGTGLAPIYGILKDAISQQHKGKINVVLGAWESSNFYLVKELQKLASSDKNLDVHFIAQESTHDFAETGDIYAYCQSEFPDLKGSRVYLCGANTFVVKMRKQCFLSGAAIKDISADIFLPSGV